MEQEGLIRAKASEVEGELERLEHLERLESNGFFQDREYKRVQQLAQLAIEKERKALDDAEVRQFYVASLEKEKEKQTSLPQFSVGKTKSDVEAAITCANVIVKAKRKLAVAQSDPAAAAATDSPIESAKKPTPAPAAEAPEVPKELKAPALPLFDYSESDEEGETS